MSWGGFIGLGASYLAITFFDPPDGWTRTEGFLCLMFGYMYLQELHKKLQCPPA